MVTFADLLQLFNKVSGIETVVIEQKRREKCQGNLVYVSEISGNFYSFLPVATLIVPAQTHFKKAKTASLCPFFCIFWGNELIFIHFISKEIYLYLYNFFWN